VRRAIEHGGSLQRAIPADYTATLSESNRPGALHSAAMAGAVFAISREKFVKYLGKKHRNAG
jgi:hypothetical protein